MPTDPYRILFPEGWLQEQLQETSHAIAAIPILPPEAEPDLQQVPAPEPAPMFQTSPTPIPAPNPAITDNSQTMPAAAMPWETFASGMQPAPFAPDPGTGISELSDGFRQYPAYAPSSAARPATRTEIEEIFDEKFSALRVYVLESDITEAQRAVKSIVELASF